MILDPFEQKLETSLVPARNETSGMNFSLKVVPFRGYNSLAFKKALE